MAGGNFGSGSDVSNGIYYVEDALDFIALKSQENKGTAESRAKIYLSNDIDMIEQVDFNGSEAGNVWVVDFDGQGHKICNIEFNGSGSWGLFFILTGNSVVQNVTVEKAQIFATSYVGMFCSYNNDTATQIVDFKNCTLNDVDITTNSNCGGYVGYATTGSILNFYDCISRCRIKNTKTGYDYGSAGGFVGYYRQLNQNGVITTVFKNCLSVCEISSDFAGGFGGTIFNTLTYSNIAQFIRCESKCVFRNCKNVAGFVYQSRNNYNFFNCKCECVFDNCTNIRGFSTTVTNAICCIAVNKIINSTPTSVTGFYNYTSGTISCYYDKDVLGFVASDESKFGVSTAELQDKNWLESNGFVFGGGS